MNKKCAECGVEFKPRHKSSTYCSRRCLWDANAKRTPHNKGSGVGWVDKRGYRWIYVNENGRQVAKREHRHVMELHLGRKLSPEELVHHINENKADNRIENLEIESWSSHTAHHNAGSVRSDQAKKTSQVLATYREEHKRLKEINFDLLEALNTLLRLHENDVWTDAAWKTSFDKARDAIAKATGNQ